MISESRPIGHKISLMVLGRWPQRAICYGVGIERDIMRLYSTGGFQKVR